MTSRAARPNTPWRGARRARRGPHLPPRQVYRSRDLASAPQTHPHWQHGDAQAYGQERVGITLDRADQSGTAQVTLACVKQLGTPFRLLDEQVIVEARELRLALDVRGERAETSKAGHGARTPHHRRLDGEDLLCQLVGEAVRLGIGCRAPQKLGW
jgi:hypothetical protein